MEIRIINVYYIIWYRYKFNTLEAISTYDYNPKSTQLFIYIIIYLHLEYTEIINTTILKYSSIIY